MTPSKPQRHKGKGSKKGLLLDYISHYFVYQYCNDSKSKFCQNGDSLAECLRKASSSSASSRSSTNCTLLNSDSSSETLWRKGDTSSDERPAPEFSDTLERPAQVASMKSKHQQHASTFTLDDIEATDTIKILAAQYGRISHMGVLDRSYSFFINKARTAALSFKVENKVAVVQGDPLCDWGSVPNLLSEFDKYRKRFRWDIAFMGSSGAFADYAKKRRWTNMQFGRERVLNPMTNDVLLERSGKRNIVQCRQLLDQSKGGVILGLYVPSHAEDLGLQQELRAAFVTVCDPFSLPSPMTYLYTRGPDGKANEFAALRKIGANQGYHIDPCVAAPGAPRGISDLLVLATMAVLHHAGISYLSFGYETLDALEEVTGMPYPLGQITHRLYDHTFKRLPIEGKKAYHNKFKPEPAQGSSLHVLFPSMIPSPRQIVAIAHMTNVSIRKLVFTDKRTSAKDSDVQRGQ